jgi:hypothetical protein
MELRAIAIAVIRDYTAFAKVDATETQSTLQIGVRPMRVSRLVPQFIMPPPLSILVVIR